MQRNYGGYKMLFVNLAEAVAFIAFTVAAGVFVADHTVPGFRGRSGATEMSRNTLIVGFLPLLSLRLWGLF